jgi:hypothetical protein
MGKSKQLLVDGVRYVFKKTQSPTHKWVLWKYDPKWVAVKRGMSKREMEQMYKLLRS